MQKLSTNAFFKFFKKRTVGVLRNVSRNPIEKWFYSSHEVTTFTNYGFDTLRTMENVMWSLKVKTLQDGRSSSQLLCCQEPRERERERMASMCRKNLNRKKIEIRWMFFFFLNGLQSYRSCFILQVLWKRQFTPKNHKQTYFPLACEAVRTTRLLCCELLEHREKRQSGLASIFQKDWKWKADERPAATSRRACGR